nr:uncharacterized protein LOC109175367 isoform X1 [Ipomoea batatas]GMD10982.1 uncharacterized protein LOC109175367 isoform X1 [Ipomoea batatas]GMD73947.1 uncharacterized protein LOC109175367 isoform X1 [Ipomoea batatas]GMD76569.1 uncharacterized protein LOC109175367 isoform X1 [Ipomoea batatas]GME08072.1 uncharacterized protein LOC109175367 isoform X1 [Ipomoea batatas]
MEFSSAAMKHWVLRLALSFILISHFRLGVGGDYDQPHTGASGVLGNEYIPSNGGGNGYSSENGGGNGYSSENGGGNGYSSEHGGSYGHENPDYVISKALLCFDEKNIYSSCEEAYRLSASGELHVPPDCTDEFCNGACLKETDLILHCIETVLSDFEFYNKATINDVRHTIKEGCSYGPNRGNFDVAEHLQYEENNAFQASKAVLHNLSLMVLALWFFL